MKFQATSRRGRHYVAAVVLGTALTTLGATGPRAAAGPISENSISNLSRYCEVCWRNAHLPADRWGDCTQDVLSRLLERVSPGQWAKLLVRDSEERRELVRAVDAVKKRVLREFKRSTPLLNPVADRRSGQDLEQLENREAVGRAASCLLSPRQQRIMHLSFEGRSVQEIASALDLSPDRVSDEKYKAIRKLRGFFRAAGLS